MTHYSKIGVLGAGAWGTAIALIISRAGHKVTLWALEKEVATGINKTHENALYLKGTSLPKSIRGTNNLELLAKQEALFLVAPAQHTKTMLQKLKAAGLPRSVPLVICSKGIAEESLKLMSEVVSEVVRNPVAVFSGPTFAAEIAENLPAAAVLACNNMQLARSLRNTLESETFKVYISRDVVGAQIGGAIKNVLAIACGMIVGRGLGENAKAALITRGLAEMKDLCVAMGGKPETLMELCGVGDLILTCNSTQSRNMSLGVELGKGKTLAAIMKKRRTVAEGVHSARSVAELAKLLGVKMPVCEAVYTLLHQNGSVEETLHRFTERKS